MHSYAEFIEMKRANICNDALVRAELLKRTERVLIIRSPRASPAFECETASTRSSLIFLSEELKAV